MATRVYVWILGTDGLQAELIAGDEFQELRYERRLNDVGELEIILGGLDQKIDAMTPDRIVHVYRVVDPPEGQVRAPYIEFEGLITDRREIQRGRERLFVAKARSFLDLVDRRWILYRTGAARTIKAAVAAETVIKEFVDHNAGPNATIGGGRLADGVTTGLAIAADSAAGQTLTGQRTQAPLLATVQRVANVSGAGGVPLIDFDVIGATPAGGFAAFQFVTFNTGRGVDRSQPVVGGGAFNAAGNRPFVFSPKMGNLQDPEIIRLRHATANRILTMGQGIRSGQLARVVDDAGAQGTTPWALREQVFNAARERTNAGLDDAGDERLQELAAADVFDANILQTGQWLYGRDYFLGDTITVQFEDFTAAKRVVSVGFEVTDGEERVNVGLAEPVSGSS